MTQIYLCDCLFYFDTYNLNAIFLYSHYNLGISWRGVGWEPYCSSKRLGLGEVGGWGKGNSEGP